MVIVVQLFVVKIVFSLEIVIGLQVIVIEDVNKDGMEVNVINVKLCFLSFLYFLYCESYIINIIMNFILIKFKKEIFIKGYKCLNLKVCIIYLC